MQGSVPPIDLNKHVNDKIEWSRHDSYEHIVLLYACDLYLYVNTNHVDTGFSGHKK